mgnify:CR=1 FL=1|jgi:hypothetical protein
MKLIKFLLAITVLLVSTQSLAGKPSDMDRDGIPDYKDHCPLNSFEELSRGVNNRGCPLQTDADGIPDFRDRCPNTPRGVKINAHGCPIDNLQHVKHRMFNNNALANIH